MTPQNHWARLSSIFHFFYHFQSTSFGIIKELGEVEFSGVLDVSFILIDGKKLFSEESASAIIA